MTGNANPPGHRSLPPTCHDDGPTSPGIPYRGACAEGIEPFEPRPHVATEVHAQHAPATLAERVRVAARLGRLDHPERDPPPGHWQVVGRPARTVTPTASIERVRMVLMQSRSLSPYLEPWNACPKMRAWTGGFGSGDTLAQGVLLSQAGGVATLQDNCGP